MRGEETTAQTAESRQQQLNQRAKHRGDGDRKGREEGDGQVLSVLVVDEVQNGGTGLRGTTVGGEGPVWHFHPLPRCHGVTLTLSLYSKVSTPPLLPREPSPRDTTTTTATPTLRLSLATPRSSSRPPLLRHTVHDKLYIDRYRYGDTVTRYGSTVMLRYGNTSIISR